MVTCASDFDKKISPQIFFGLAGDEKPTKTYKGIEVTNGSIFIYIDVGNYAMYDAINHVWCER